MAFVVSELKYIIDQMRTRGSFTKTSGVEPDLPCNSIVCGHECTKLADLPNGDYKYYSASPYYYFGTKKEIVARLEEKNKAISQERKTKYPAIILEHNHKEGTFQSPPKSVDLSILFATETQEKYSYQQRYDFIIEPILLPLFEDFQKKAKASSNVASYELVEMQINPLFGDGAIIASDYWDMISAKIRITFINNCKKFNLCQF